MNKDFMKKYLENPNYIQGIYNYCDRWCKKCNFTDKCMHFALSEEHFPEQDSKNLTNKVFWQKISELFKVTLEMLNDLIEKEDIDMNMFDSQKAMRELDERKAEVKKHECSVAANEYIDMVNRWFSNAEEILLQNEDIANLNSEYEFEREYYIESVNELKDHLETIQWYQYQIYIKINRAVEEKLATGNEPDELQSAYNGSAKVTLIGIDSSLLSWEYMMFKFPEKEDEVLEILVHLGRLRKKMEAEFPFARSFVRPGFDEESPRVLHNLEK